MLVLLRLNFIPDPGMPPPSNHRFTNDFINAFVDKYVVKSEPFLVVAETGKDGDNPHYHLAFTTTAKLQAIRTYINRSAWKGNQNYSLKLGKDDLIESHFDYLCKGSSPDDSPSVFMSSDHFDDTVIKERHQRFWVKNQEFVKGNRKRKSDSRLPIGEQIYTICKQKVHGGTIPSEDQVIEIAMRWYITNKTSMSVYHVTNVVNWVIGKLHGTTEGLDDLGKDLFDSNRMEVFKQNCKLKLNNY